jgi:HSP20 family molecular chaperone IbpA
MFDLFDPFRVFSDIDRRVVRHRSDAIDEEGVKIELPGVKASDVDVSIDGRILKVTGKSRHGTEFSYAYTLKSSVDESTITANLTDGLLAISLPKKVDQTARKIIVTS